MFSRQKIKKALPWIVLLAAYLCSVAYWGLYGTHNLNADDSAEMILAAQLNEEGAILSENWFYSTELRLASPVIVYQLALRLFPNDWHAARTCAVAIVTLLVLSSVLYAAYGLKLRKSAPWMAAVFVIPFSGAYAWVVLYQCYYSMHWIMSLLMLGMLGRLAEAKGKRRLGLWIGLCVLAGIGGLNGVRMMTMFIVPACGAVILMCVLACKAYPTFREAAHEPAMKLLLPMLTATGLAGAGYVVNMRVLSARYHYYNYGLESLKDFTFSDFLHQIDGWVDMFGYWDGASFFSLQGISSVIAFGVVILFALAALRLFIRWGEISMQLRLLLLTAALAVALGMTLNVLLGQALVRYYLVGVVLTMMVLAAAIETEPCKNETLRMLAGGLVFCCLVFQTGCNLLYGYRQGKVNYEMAAEWLLQKGYTQGYATYWNAFPLTEVSDGRITIWGLNAGNWPQLELFPVNQSKNRFEQEPEGKVFLLVDEIENMADSPLLSEEHFVDFVGWSYFVYEYDSVEDMRALIARQ